MHDPSAVRLMRMMSEDLQSWPGIVGEGGQQLGGKTVSVQAVGRYRVANGTIDVEVTYGEALVESAGLRAVTAHVAGLTRATADRVLAFVRDLAPSATASPDDGTAVRVVQLTRGEAVTLLRFIDSRALAAGVTPAGE